MEKEFTSVSDMDSFFESNKVEAEVKEEEAVEEIETVEDIPELDVEDDVDEEEDEIEDDTQEEEESEEDETPKQKPSKEEKRDYAFSKLRKEAAEAKKAYEERDALIQRLMKEAGYSEYSKFKEALDVQFSEKEMKNKGYTKEQYNEVEELRKRTKELEQKLEMTTKQEMVNKAKNFDTMVKSYASQYRATAKEVYEALDASGFTAEILLNLPNPEVLIRGVLADKVKTVEKPAKKAVDTEKLPSGSKQKSEFNIEDLLKADLDEYRTRKGNA